MRGSMFTPLRGILAVSILTIGVVMVAGLLGVFGGVATAGDLPAAAKQMSVFKTEPVRDTALPKAVVQARHRLVTKGSLGSVMPNETRLLADNLGVNNVAIYAFPSTGGAVCAVVTETTSVATCIPGGLDGFESIEGGVAWGIYSGEGVPQTVYGLASDEVAGVKVVVDGTEHEAELIGNSIYWQADPEVTRRSIRALNVRQLDDEIVRVNLDFGR
jgi:hypothetical protein